MFTDESSTKTFMFAERPKSNALANYRVEVLRRYDNRCCYCGQEGGSLVVDLIIPRKKLMEMGRDEYSLENMALACVKCNNTKGSRLYTPDLFDATCAPDIRKQEYRKYYNEVFT